MNQPLYQVRTIFILVIILTLTKSFCQPVDNPIASYYTGSEGYPGWTDNIKWGNVYNVATQDYSSCPTCPGNDFEKFKFVRDLAYNAGGGVLYYPAGTYEFDISDNPNSEGLMLKKGVVIRGEKPSADMNAITVKDINQMSPTDHGLNNMPTKFKFTTTNLNGKLLGQIAKMWNTIGIKKGANESGLHEVNEVGVCWVELQYGYIFFGFDASAWAPTWGEAAYDFGKSVQPWRGTRNPDGTHPMDHFCGNKTWNKNDSIMMGSKRFVFGVHLKNCGVPNYVAAHGLPADSFYCEDSPWHFGAKISVYGADVFIGNNVIAKASASFPFQLTCFNGNLTSRPRQTIKVPYDFGKGLSIDVNKNYIAGFINRSQVENPSSQYAPNVIIRDNWIYNHSNKSVDAGGSWMVIKNNICRREKYSKNVDVYGTGLPLPIWATMTSNGRCRTNVSPDDYLARGFTLSVNNAWVDSNQLGGTGTDFDNSGEGIMVQDHLNGSECYSLAITNNTYAKPSVIPGGPGWMGVWNSHAVGVLLGYNKTVNSITLNVADYLADASEIEHIHSVTGAQLNTSGNFPNGANRRDYRVFACPGDPDPGIPQISVKDTADFVKISWTNVENEAGYRIERRRLGNPNWTTIAYRPRQETGGLVTFGFGPEANGFIATNDGYPPAPYNTATWDGKVRNMNPPIWRDYTKMAGTFEYRVVAVACRSANEGSSDSVAVVVTTKPLFATKMGNEILVFPVPANEEITIRSSDLKDGEAKVINPLGQIVYSGKTNSTESLILKCIGWAPGLYTIQIQGNQKSETKRFIVRH